jgi:hypothetical protein
MEAMVESDSVLSLFEFSNDNQAVASGIYRTGVQSSYQRRPRSGTSHRKREAAKVGWKDYVEKSGTKR